MGYQVTRSPGYKNNVKNKLSSIYRKLYKKFGAQEWWPADTSFEVMVGAILTQNTNWQNVEKAITNLKKEKLLSPLKLNGITLKRLAKLIRPSGYYNIKAARLKSFLDFFIYEYQADITRMRSENTSNLRKKLLAVKGVGYETADSILLYALEKPVFVVDSYTKRIFSRHGFFKEESDYNIVQKFFMDNLDNKVSLFNEFHALIVKTAKEFCRKQKPLCHLCPLK